jgi:hypothetical protein
VGLIAVYGQQCSTAYVYGGVLQAVGLCPSHVSKYVSIARVVPVQLTAQIVHASVGCNVGVPGFITGCMPSIACSRVLMHCRGVAVQLIAQSVLCASVILLFLCAFFEGAVCMQCCSMAEGMLHCIVHPLVVVHTPVRSRSCQCAMHSHVLAPHNSRGRLVVR